MHKTFEITDGNGVILNRIIADDAFMKSNYASGTYYEVPIPVIQSIGTRALTTSAFRARLTIDEEVSIVDGSDTKAKLYYSRIMQMPYINLDSADVVTAVDYLANYLHDQGVIEDPVARYDELLAGGAASEEYTGVVAV